MWMVGPAGRARRWALIALLASGLPLTMGGCSLDNFTTTQTVSLSGRDIASYLVQALIVTPMQDAINGGVDALFDHLENNDQ